MTFTAFATESAEKATTETEEKVLPGYAQYVDQVAAAEEEQKAKDEAERVAGLSAEELAAEAEAAEASKRLDYATTYIDGYADAIQKDANNKTNIEEAVKEVRSQTTPFYATFWSILPALIAIALALITKEVYSSLFIGIVAGGVLYANFNFEGTFNHVINSGFIASLSDSYNVGILLFLVLLGTLVAIMNKAGGSAAFGRWASKHIKSRVGAQLATIALGVLIFVDDYFNCLTVGSVMRPVADAKKISRAKLAYLIDATAAPVCIIAPISSWAAAVSGFAPEGVSGLSLFIQAIPFNFYALLTIIMMVTITLMKFDFGPMKLHEKNAEEKGDLFTTLEETAKAAEEQTENKKGKVIDLIIPVVILIICCIIGMIYSGGFFSGENFIDAFSNCDASVGLALGSIAAIILVMAYFIIFRHGTVNFSELMGCLPEGFKAMVPAILILTCAWTLKGMTDSLGATVFIAEFVNNNAQAFVNFLPAIIFLIAVGLSFSTGTSWGTFGILIPIVLAVFEPGSSMAIIGMSACMAGAVCGDHCSPISDTTIMASAGAQCNHVNHVNTQLPYALLVAGVSFVSYIIAGFIPNALIALPIAIVLMLATLFILKAVLSKKNA
ncbi:MAG: Na+/H+ antiporter NhaC family protein [Ruminococcaceae bacterium]|nr:Na+/H+ antiporter NhaC family protein [Oscillospiraceae bacterium]